MERGLVSRTYRFLRRFLEKCNYKKYKLKQRSSLIYAVRDGFPWIRFPNYLNRKENCDFVTSNNGYADRFFISTPDLCFILMLMADSPNIHVEISIRNDYQRLKYRNILSLIRIFVSAKHNKAGNPELCIKKKNKIIKISLATLWIEKSNLTRLTLPLITITTFVTALSLALPFPKANHPRFLPLFSYFIFHFIRFIS